MAQPMNANDAQMIFCARYPDTHVVKVHQLRALKQILPARLFKVAEPAMQIDQGTFCTQAGESSLSRFVLVRRHAQVDIDVMPQTWLGVKTSRIPALNQDRFDASGAEQCKNHLDVAPMNSRLQTMQSISILELNSHD